MARKKTRKFKAEVSQVLSLVINSLYSNKEIFLRELLSNASDALDKLRFEAITSPELLEGDRDLRIRLSFDEEAGTLTIWDNGVGMTEEELITNLGTVAHSGSKSFISQLEEASRSDVNLIGQFGVGFYSSYLVADRVEVLTRRAGTDEAFRWSSDAQEKFTVEPDERELRGTSVILHLREDQKEFLDRWRVRGLVGRYSDYLDFPVEMLKEAAEDEEPEWERVNQAGALWMRSSGDVSDEQYEEFYKHLTHDWEKPLGHTHFKIEGTQLFRGMLFVPRRPPFDLFDPDAKHGVRLYVKRVFIMDDCDDLLPRWLRFMRGVVDSDDLPLNVSRELLQDSRLVRVMRKQVVKKSLDLLESIAADKPDEYGEFWEKFGSVLKEGLHFAPDHKDRLAKLCRFESSTDDGITSLAQYVERMNDEQPAIYYALAQSRSLLESSPHLEVLKKKGYEVLYLTDGIDQWAIESVDEFEGKPLVNAMKADLDLGEAENEDNDERDEKLEPLTKQFQEILDEHVSEVRISGRLHDSPVCLVIPEGGLAAHIERMLRAHKQDLPPQKRILEINPDHPLIGHIQSLSGDEDTRQKVTEWVEMLYDQALLSEGSPISDPGRFAKRMTKLMEQAVRA